VAEQQSSYDFVAVDSKDILAERQEEWTRFTQFVTWATGATVIVLALMAIFLV
jgi:hypothetical protein